LGLVLSALIFFWVKQVGWPLEKCDFVSDSTTRREEHKKIGSIEVSVDNPRIDCFLQEIDLSPNPDIRWCYKPVFKEHFQLMDPFDCAMKIVLKTKKYAFCEQIFVMTNNKVSEWQCIGALSKEIGDNNKCESAPNDDLKGFCQDAKPGHESTGTLDIGVP